jgi:hypothetical protein
LNTNYRCIWGFDGILVVLVVLVAVPVVDAVRTQNAIAFTEVHHQTIGPTKRSLRTPKPLPNTRL